VPAKSYYELLDLPPSASSDDIKKAFRQQIARYHPDKVQHLGKEFQDMAADRAAELTEAYRILSNEGNRAEYDRTLGAGPGAPAPAATAHPPAAQAPPPSTPHAQKSDGPAAQGDRPATDAGPGASAGRGAFHEERAGRDDYLRKATLSRFQHAVEAVAEYDASSLTGFDLALIPKAKMFGRSKNPRLLGRYVSMVDGPAVADAMAQAGKWSPDEICVFLLGTALAPARELAGAISEQRRRHRAKVTLIPVDARDWGSYVPNDAPEIAKSLLARLKRGT
jgi:curved DNA-binding protein CbpA